MPNSIVEPSSTRAATYSPIRRVSSFGSGSCTSISGSSAGTSTSMSWTYRKLLPSVRGMWGLTWAMTRLAFSAALLTMSTEMPRLHMPRLSGGVTWISATSSGSWPDVNRRGMSDRKIGV